MPSPEVVRYAVKAALESDEFRQVLVQEHVARGGSSNVEFPEISTTTVFNVETFPYVELVMNMARNVVNDSQPVDLLHEMNVFWYERGDEEEDLENRVTRALWAIRTFFQKLNPYLSGVANAPVYLGDDNFSPFVPAGPYEGRPFVKAGMTTLYVRTLD